MWKNKLYFGDNLDILRRYIPAQSIDLIYLDPPFNSSTTYNVLFQERSGEQSAAQVTAFEDTWRWTLESESVFREIVSQSEEQIVNVMQSFRALLGASDTMAYLVMMTARLIELHRVLKPTGSIYLHCDPTASHYLKLAMDAIFKIDNFRSEIVWKRSSAHSDTKQGRKQHGRIHDVILFYTKGDTWTWNPIHTPYDEDYVKQFYRHIEPGTGRRYRLGDLTGPGGAAKGNPSYEVLGVTRHWRYSKERMNQLISEGRVVQTRPGTVPQYKRYLDEMPGVPLQDLWTDINPIAAQAGERLGYPTQKPEALLERIIRTSSNEGDIVLDPFCGCGTTISVAERLHRKWVGIDITHLAISLIRGRLHDAFGRELSEYEVIGEPKDHAGAEALAVQDRYQFEWWAVGIVGGRPAQDKKKGKDAGVDGYIHFFDDTSNKPKKIVIQVKSGHTSSRDIRDLKGVLEREKAQIGVFITLQQASRDMEIEALSAGFYESSHYGNFPKIQILTVEDLLRGVQVRYPQSGAATFKRAQRQTKTEEQQEGLF